MEDIIGREVKENDLVLGMTIGRHSDGMRFGVYNGTSVNWRNGVTSVPNNVYLIANPTEREQGIKQKIIENIDKLRKEEEESLAKRRALKRIPTKDLVVGGSYADDTGSKYVYLGKGSVYDSYNGKTSVGYVYLSCWSDSYNKEADVFSSLPYVTVLKNPKKLVDTVDKIIDYDFDKSEFILRETVRKSWFGGNDRAKSLKFTLEGGGKSE